MSADLIVAGPFQGLSWAALQMWDASIDISIPFWAVRLVAGVLMFSGLLVFLYNIAMTAALARRAQSRARELVGAATA